MKWELLRKVILADRSLRDCSGIKEAMTPTAEADALAAMLRRRDEAAGKTVAHKEHRTRCLKFVRGAESGQAREASDLIEQGLVLRNDDYLFACGRTTHLAVISPEVTRPLNARLVDPNCSHDQFESDLAELHRLTYLYLPKATSVADLRRLLQTRLELALVVENPLTPNRLRSMIRMRSLTFHGVEQITSGRVVSGFELTSDRRPSLISPPADGDIRNAAGLYVSMIVDPDESRSLLLGLINHLGDYSGRIFTKPSTDEGRRFCRKRGVQVADSPIWEIDRSLLPRRVVEKGRPSI